MKFAEVVWQRLTPVLARAQLAMMRRRSIAATAVSLMDTTALGSDRQLRARVSRLVGAMLEKSYGDDSVPDV